MTVSYSDFGIYRRCPRQWAYKMMAQWNATDGRREFYLLKQLQSLSAWRGSLVDAVISDFVIPTWAQGGAVSLEETLNEAQRRVGLQLEFGLARRAREDKMSRNKAGKAFAAFYEVEYGDGLGEQGVERAKQEIETALTHLFGMRDLVEALRSATFLRSQQELSLERAGVKVRAIPDVIAVWRDGRPPLILDWKVNAFGQRDARSQLALYALSLIDGSYRADFVPSLRRWKTTDVRLLEVQLLSNHQRPYSLTDEDVEEVESQLSANIAQLNLATEQLAPKDWEPMEFPTTQFSETCASCNFRKPCWDGKWKVDAAPKSNPKPRRKTQ